jgi:hypothetical protein
VASRRVRQRALADESESLRDAMACPVSDSKEPQRAASLALESLAERL